MGAVGAMLGKPAGGSIMIANYLDELRRELAFDPALSRRLREEIEKPLARICGGSSMSTARRMAERIAIERFGRTRNRRAVCRPLFRYRARPKTRAAG